MSKKDDKTIEEVNTPSGSFKGKISVKDACKLMTHGAYCRWIPLIIYLILFAAVVYLLQAPALSIIGVRLFDASGIFKQILKTNPANREVKDI